MPSEHPYIEIPDAGGQRRDSQPKQPGFCKRHPVLTAVAGFAALVGGAAQVGTCYNERGNAAIAEAADQRRLDDIDRAGNWSTGTTDDCTNLAPAVAQAAGCDKTQE